jgi:hypothetical protein
MEAAAEIKILKEKINKLLGLYVQAKEENIGLREKNDILADELKSCKEQVNSAESQIQMLKVASTVSGVGEDPHDAKIIINRIVREIDKCIALLNK